MKKSAEANKDGRRLSLNNKTIVRSIIEAQKKMSPIETFRESSLLINISHGQVDGHNYHIKIKINVIGTFVVSIELNFFSESIMACNFDVHIKILHNTTIKTETIKNMHTLL